MAKQGKQYLPKVVWLLEEYLGIPHVKNNEIFRDYDKANVQGRKAIQNCS